MTSEEIRALVIESGGDYSSEGRDLEVAIFTNAELTVFVAAVEAKARRKCADAADEMPDHCSAYEAAEKIRSL